MVHTKSGFSCVEPAAGGTGRLIPVVIDSSPESAAALVAIPSAVLNVSGKDTYLRKKGGGGMELTKSAVLCCCWSGTSITTNMPCTRRSRFLILLFPMVG